MSRHAREEVRVREESVDARAAPPEGEDLLSLQEAADRLKVHYMTAYRWVRRGDLPAFKAGGRLRVRARDLARFVAEREVDVVTPTRGHGRTDWPAHVARLHELLVAGAGVDAGHLLRKVVADGAPVGDVYLELLAPALHAVGEDWAQGRIGVAEEHRASAIVAAAMARLAPSFRRRGPTRGTAASLTPPDEQHALGALMAADFLRSQGYEVHHLGAGVPLVDLARFFASVHVDVACVSATMPADAGVVRALAEACAPAPLLLGGQGADAHVASAAGAHHVPRMLDLAPALDAARGRDGDVPRSGTERGF